MKRTKDELFKNSLDKINYWRNLGIEPYGSSYSDVKRIKEIRKYLNEENNLIDKDIESKIAGRIIAIRNMGKSIFLDLKDSSDKIQIYLNINNTIVESINDKSKNFEIIKQLNIGDIIGVSGTLFFTKMNEFTVKAKTIKILSKSLRTLPEKWNKLVDQETRYRKRYLDFISNEFAMDIIKKRFIIISEIRKFLTKSDYIEVETPILQDIAGGAIAKPFKTFCNALSSKEMNLRISPEIYLKKFLISGFEKVFEIGKNFRNEGISKKHSPEFTSLEIYQAYGDCRTMMELAEQLIYHILIKINGTSKINSSKGEIDFKLPWKRINYEDLFKLEIEKNWFLFNMDDKINFINNKFNMNYKIDDFSNNYELDNEIYSKFIEPKLINPTFVTRLPVQSIPLAKRCIDNRNFIDVFELEINGSEIAPGYSELNDPIEQKNRFFDQHKDDKDFEQNIDYDFIEAMEYGMPPAGGIGIGIDRLVMLITGTDAIREVIPFSNMMK